MRLYIYPTDLGWYDFLRQRRELDEVNFWQPGGRTAFARLTPGDLFLFRLKNPVNAIAGGGTFVHSSLYPLDLAWAAFGEKNGTPSLDVLRSRAAKYRGIPVERLDADARIGCIILQNPFFFGKESWIPLPPDYSVNLVQGKRYDASVGVGRSLYESVIEALQRLGAYAVGERTPLTMYGDPVLVKRRLGQGAFRVLITDKFDRRCAITGEKTLPVLQAAHIKPVSCGGEHRSDNGLLLRSDLHTLFDLGYVTVTPTYRFQVGAALRNAYTNGRVYYELQGRELNLPAVNEDRPAKEFLEWHTDTVFRG